jgi:hypothetical protein
MAQEPELRWIDPGVGETRAELCQVQSTRRETMLLFGRRRDGRAMLERRIVLTPSLAKELAGTLVRAVRAQEQLSGGDNATPAGSIESAAREEDAPAAARPLLGLVGSLGVGYGFEKSFKMTPGALRDDRLILGVRTRLARPSAFLEVCRRIGMPADYLAQFESRLPEANTAGFGFEGDEHGGVYKAYLEFWDALWQRVQREPRNSAPALLFLGFKWGVKGASRRALARYTCHPLLSVRRILRRLDALYADRPESPSRQAAREILARAASRVSGDSFVYVEAEEEGNPRRSFDLNLYKARLRVGDLQPPLQALAERYGVTPSLGNLMGEAGARPFGHLSGGVGRDGRDFLTVYYEIEGL